MFCLRHSISRSLGGWEFGNISRNISIQTLASWSTDENRLEDLTRLIACRSLIDNCWTFKESAVGAMTVDSTWPVELHKESFHCFNTVSLHYTLQHFYFAQLASIAKLWFNGKKLFSVIMQRSSVIRLILSNSSNSVAQRSGRNFLLCSRNIFFVVFSRRKNIQSRGVKMVNICRQWIISLWHCDGHNDANFNYDELSLRIIFFLRLVIKASQRASSSYAWEEKFHKSAQIHN